MEYLTFEFVLGFLLAVALMVGLWVPLFFLDYKAEKKRGAQPIGSGENPPTPPLDKVRLN
ncbi:MAG TPA: hypothetical protein VJM31_06325 [Vicinamibacterales bacterium]|nr:hypothetical protein [Vicinamibacterales bacterium]